MSLLRQYQESLPRELAATARRDVLLYLVIAVYVAIGLAFVHAESDITPRTFLMYAKVWGINYLFLFPLGYYLIGFVRIILGVNKRRSLAMRLMFSPRRLARFIAGTGLIMALMPFQATFTSVKNALSVDGFKFDEIQADIDKFIHMGVDPWRLLYGITDNRYVLFIIEQNYNVLWFLLCFAALYWVLVSPKADQIRTRYVLSFMLVWIVIGNILAGIYISAGPAFYGYVTGDFARFGGQLAVLALNEGHASSAFEYQKYLWLLHEKGQTGLASGVSAFPSVHVGLIMMNALFLNEYSRKLGFMAFAYTGFIVMSSVYLGWHYAIDGYVSIAVVLVLYYAGRYAANFISLLLGRESNQFGTASPKPARTSLREV